MTWAFKDTFKIHAVLLKYYLVRIRREQHVHLAPKGDTKRWTPCRRSHKAESKPKQSSRLPKKAALNFRRRPALPGTQNKGQWPRRHLESGKTKVKKHRRLVAILTLFGSKGIQVGESLSPSKINKGPGDLTPGKLRWSHHSCPHTSNYRWPELKSTHWFR